MYSIYIFLVAKLARQFLCVDFIAVLVGTSLVFWKCFDLYEFQLSPWVFIYKHWLYKHKRVLKSIHCGIVFGRSASQYVKCLLRSRQLSHGTDECITHKHHLSSHPKLTNNFQTASKSNTNKQTNGFSRRAACHDFIYSFQYTHHKCDMYGNRCRPASFNLECIALSLFLF